MEERFSDLEGDLYILVLMWSMRTRHFIQRLIKLHRERLIGIVLGKSSCVVFMILTKL